MDSWNAAPSEHPEDILTRREAVSLVYIGDGTWMDVTLTEVAPALAARGLVTLTDQLGHQFVEPTADGRAAQEVYSATGQFIGRPTNPIRCSGL